MPQFEVGDLVKGPDGEGYVVKVGSGEMNSLIEFTNEYGITRGCGWARSRGDGTEVPRDYVSIASNRYYWVDLEEDYTLMATKKKTPVKLDPAPLDNVVLPKEARQEILAVLKQHENQNKLFTEWGLGEVIEYGKGMTFLFYGPPGTGKTWASVCMAKAMGQELLTISAAEIQTSEPGGANRAIVDAFKSAKSRNKVLLFDECDSLITVRSDVGMVIASEINTLLTEIEKCEGIVILTTNRVESLDPALERRISLILEFTDPTYEQRADIWKRLLPKKMPLGKGVNIAKLAEYKLTGGQIKNVVLQAARLALAEEQAKVDLIYFESAIVRIQASKSLLGTASRFRAYTKRDDYTKASADIVKATP